MEWWTVAAPTFANFFVHFRTMTIDHMPFLYELPLTAGHGTDRMVDRSCPDICKFLSPFSKHDD